jgi:WD40 repeat protein
LKPVGPSIFISYAHKDGVRLAKRLQTDLSTQGLPVWLDTERIHGGASWSAEIDRALDISQVILALLTPGSYESDLCRAEQLRALRKGKRVIPLLAELNTAIPLHLETRHFLDFTGARPYEVQLQLLFDDIRNAANVVPIGTELRATHVTVPPLPSNYIERPDTLAMLRSRLIADGGGPSIALTALRGMGGIGKTVLAQALAHDQIVQEAFPDGVIWTTVGKQGTHNVAVRMREVRRAFSDTPAESETESESINRYRTLMQDKRALIILDDVWHAGDVEPFRVSSSLSRLLFTTRDAFIVASVGAVEHIADLLTPGQSRDLLARWARCNAEDLPAEADAILQECGRLPLTLSIVGAILRGKPPAYWTYTLNLLHRADLNELRVQFPGYPHPDLLRAIQVSVDALDETARNRYLALALLIEDMPLHSSVQRALWSATEESALATAEQFVGLSLAQRDQGGSIRLHDLHLDYLRAQFADRAALDLVHAALQLSWHVISRDATQFVSQVVGRLLPFQAIPGVEQITRTLIKGVPFPWLRPVVPALSPPGSALLRTLEGRFSEITALALAPDGRHVFAASGDREIVSWDLESGREARSLTGLRVYIFGLAISPDGRRAISISPGSLRIWDIETGYELHTVQSQSDYFGRVLLTADGNLAISASLDKLKVWDLQTGLLIRTLEGHFDFPFMERAAVSLQGRWAVSASVERITMWDLETGRKLHTMEDHFSPVSCIAVTPDGRRVLFGCENESTVTVWHVESGRLFRMTGHSGPVRAVAACPDVRRAVSASDDRCLKVWDVETGHELQTWMGHSDSVTKVVISANGRRAASVSNDNTLRVWSLEEAVHLGRPVGHSDAIVGVAVTQDRQVAVSASQGGALRLWDAASGRALRRIQGSFLVRGIVLTPDDLHIVEASLGNSVRVRDLQTGRTVRTLEGHLKPVGVVALTPNGLCAVSASEDNTLKVWDLATGHELRTLYGHSSFVNGVAVAPDGRRAVSASSDKTVKVWDVEGGRELLTLTGHVSAVNGVALTPDGCEAVSVSDDSTLKVWDLGTGRLLRTLKGHSGSVSAVALSPNGRFVASVSRDNSIRVWVRERGTLLAAFTCDAPPRCCVFSNNRNLIAGDDTGRIHFLSLEFGTPSEDYVLHSE